MPLGKAGKLFVTELARMYEAFAMGSAMESIILPILLLQRPHKRSNPKEHANCLERCLKFWMDGDLDALFRENLNDPNSR